MACYRPCRSRMSLFASPNRMDDPTPRAAARAVFVRQGGFLMPRPTEHEQERRRREFWRALAETGSLKAAAAVSGLDPRRLVDMLDDPATIGAAGALLDRQAA